MGGHISRQLTLLGAIASGLPLPGLSAQDPLYAFYGDHADYMGASVAGAGDVNGDGHDDVIVGAPGEDDNGVSSGSARVFSGADGSVIYRFHGDGFDYFGSSVDSAGDVNQDGYDDVIVGASGDEDSNGVRTGSARVLSGADGSILYTFYGDPAGRWFGSSVAGAGDVNKDGFPDFIVAAVYGYVHVLSGVDGSILSAIYAKATDYTDGKFAVSVDGVGDVNNDGYDDIVIGTLAYNMPDPGRAEVFSGVDGSRLYTFHSTDNSFGYSVAGAGDVNRDGYDDIIVAAVFSSGRVFSGADGAILHDIGPSNGSVAGAGDVNHDGYDDVIIGLPASWPHKGKVRVVSVADGSILNTLYGNSAGDSFGQSVASAGDVNRDGYADVIVGAPSDELLRNRSGSAYVFAEFVCCPSEGQSCTIAPCYDCPEMAAETVGAPFVGNSGFALELSHAPYNASFAILAIGSGYCHPKGVQINFCDTVRVGSPTIIVGAPLGAGLGFCGSTAQVKTPIPLAPALVGTEYSFQWAVSCGSTTPGTSITNCVTFVVTK